MATATCSPAISTTDDDDACGATLLKFLGDDVGREAVENIRSAFRTEHMNDVEFWSRLQAATVTNNRFTLYDAMVALLCSGGDRHPDLIQKIATTLFVYFPDCAVSFPFGAFNVACLLDAHLLFWCALPAPPSNAVRYMWDDFEDRLLAMLLETVPKAIAHPTLKCSKDPDVDELVKKLWIWRKKSNVYCTDHDAGEVFRTLVTKAKPDNCDDMALLITLMPYDYNNNDFVFASLFSLIMQAKETARVTLNDVGRPFFFWCAYHGITTERNKVWQSLRQLYLAGMILDTSDDQWTFRQYVICAASDAAFGFGARRCGFQAAFGKEAIDRRNRLACAIADTMFGVTGGSDAVLSVSSSKNNNGGREKRSRSKMQ